MGGKKRKSGKTTPKKKRSKKQKGNKINKKCVWVYFLVILFDSGMVVFF